MALSNDDARGGDVVAIQGMGGLGHLGIQFANKLGFKTVALSRVKDKEEMARQVGHMSTSIQQILMLHKNCRSLQCESHSCNITKQQSHY